MDLHCDEIMLSGVKLEKPGVIQCAALNMSGTTYEAEIVALPCDAEYPIICRYDMGEFGRGMICECL